MHCFRFGERFTCATEKSIQIGGKVVTFSDSNGYIYDKEGINAEIAYIRNSILKIIREEG